MLGEPGDLEADILGELHELRVLVIELRDRLRGVALRHQAEEAEVHGLRFLAYVEIVSCEIVSCGRLG